MRIKRWFRELFEKEICRFSNKCENYSKCRGYRGKDVCHDYKIRFSSGFILCKHYRKLRNEG